MDVNVQLYAKAALPPREKFPCTHLIGGWVGPRASLYGMVKSKFSSLTLPGIEYRSSNPYPSHHTD